MVASKTLVRPFVKWAGGKRQLVSKLVESHLPREYDTKQNLYYEPFVGGGALLFNLQPKRTIINDINTEVINCYKVNLMCLLVRK
jgi:DNA adenine methylase